MHVTHHIDLIKLIYLILNITTPKYIKILTVCPDISTYFHYVSKNSKNIQTQHLQTKITNITTLRDFGVK